MIGQANFLELFERHTAKIMQLAGGLHSARQSTDLLLRALAKTFFFSSTARRHLKE